MTPAASTGPLSGIRVIDWTIVMAGPFGSSLLAALGADVIKIEQPPMGDSLRHSGPIINGEALIFVSFNAGKRSVLLDLKRESDRAHLWKLIESADVMMNNFRPGVAERLEVGESDVLSRNPDLVYLSSTAWGDLGPMANELGLDHTVAALSGFGSLSGAEGEAGGIRRFRGHVDINTGIYIASAILTALYARQQLGGMGVRISMLEAAIALQSTRLSEYLIGGSSPTPIGSAAAVVAPSQCFRCGDGGYLAVSAETQAQWLRLCEAIGRQELMDDARFRTGPERVRHRADLAAVLGLIFAGRAAGEWVALLQEARVPAAEPIEWPSVPASDQIRANDYIVELESRRCGPVNVSGPPWRFRNAPAQIRREPGLGEHTAEVLTELDAVRVRRPRIDRRRTGLPLAGLRVVEIAAGIGGPYAGSLFASQGAEVVKIEWGDGDHLREWGPPALNGSGTAFVALNRNKRIVRLEHTRLLDLVGEADVVLADAFDTDGAPGPLSESEARIAKPDLVWCSISPYGEGGPLAGLPGSELTAQLLATCWSDQEEGGEPIRLGADQASVSAGLLAYQGALASLIRRTRTGEGDRVEVSLLGAMTCVMGWNFTGLADQAGWKQLTEGGVHVAIPGAPSADLPVYFSLNTASSGARKRPDIQGLVVRLGGELPEGMDPGAAYGFPANPMDVRWRPFWANLFKKFGCRELAEILRLHGGQAVPFLDYPALDRHPQIEVLKVFVPVTLHGEPGRAVRTPWRTTALPATQESLSRTSLVSQLVQEV